MSPQLPDPKPGDVYGRWLVLREAPRKPRTGQTKLRRWFAVRCRCGREKVLELRNLRSGVSTGCTEAACRDRWKREEAVRQVRELLRERYQARGDEALVAELEEVVERVLDDESQGDTGSLSTNPDRL